MQNARAGVLYLWQGTSVDWSPASEIVGTAFSIAGGAMDIADVSLPAPEIIPASGQDAFGAATMSASETVIGGVSASLTAAEADPQTRSRWETVKSWAKDFVAKIWDEIKAVVGWGDMGEMAGKLKNLALFVAQQVFSKIAPLLGNAVGLAQGLWKLTVGVVERFRVYLSGRGVKLMKGAPTVLVNGIKNALNRAILEGLQESIRSAVGVALNVLTAGASVIFDAVAGIVDAVVRLIWRIAEVLQIKKFIREAKEHWQIRDEAISITRNSQGFADWLEQYVTRVPIIAAATLGSGIAGDKMRFIQMYSGEGRVISQSSFDSAVQHLDMVKISGSRYMERTGLQFQSGDPTIDGLHKLARNHVEVQAKTKRRWRWFRRADNMMRA